MYGINLVFEEKAPASNVEKIAGLLKESEFTPVSGSLYACRDNGLVNGFQLTEKLKKEPDLTACIKKMHIFRLEDLSDLTLFVKE